MKLRLPFALLLSLSFLSVLTGQTKVQLSLPQAIGLGGPEVMCVPVVADSFPRIISASFSVGWDTSVVEFTEARLGNNPLALNDMSIRTEDADNFAIATISSDLTAYAVAPGDTLFQLCFLAKQPEGSTQLTWQGFFAPEFAQEGTTVAFPFDTIPGSLTYGASVATSVLPGDTNADGQVDHRDLLNIGLIHGTSGPARPASDVSFVAQLAARWNLSLPGSLDHANADTDGNGLIEVADLDLVNDYYRQTAPGISFVEAPAAANNDGPSFIVDSPINVDAGQPSELSIALSDGNNNNAVGYSLAFALAFDPDQVDVSDLTFNFSEAYLGDDLLTITNVSGSPGRVEIALSRKDQLNTTTPGGEIVRIGYTPKVRTDNESYALELNVIPNAFLRSDGSSAPLQGTMAEIMVIGSVSTREPTWAKELTIFPNPYSSGALLLQGPLPVLREVQLLDISGRRLQQYSGNVRRLDLTQLPAGTYLLQLRSSTETVTRRLVKQ